VRLTIKHVFSGGTYVALLIHVLRRRTGASQMSRQQASLPILPPEVISPAEPVDKMAPVQSARNVTSGPADSPPRIDGDAPVHSLLIQWIFVGVIGGLWGLSFTPGLIGKFLHTFSAILFP
jgi:hypothetical protein